LWYPYPIYEDPWACPILTEGGRKGPAAVITMIHGITWLLQDVGLLKKSVNTTRNNKGYNSLGLLTEHSTRLVSYWKGQ
jgi:hypothetical protein